MGEAMRMMGENPLAAVTVAFAVLLVMYFFLRTLVKIALVVLILALAIGGYWYFQYPEQRPATLEEAVEKTLSGTGRTLEKGREVLDKSREVIGRGKEYVEQGKDLIGQGKNTLDQGIDKGKKVIERSKSAAEDIGKIIGGEKAKESR